jgi:hypothetical protein
MDSGHLQPADTKMSSSEILQFESPRAPLVGVPWRARLRAQCREFLLRSWTLHQMHRGIYSHEGALQLAAMLDGAEYAAEHMRGAYASSDRNEILLRGIDQAPHEGLFLEFGVWSGRAINLTAERVNTTVHGFERFEEPPTDWRHGYSRDHNHMGSRQVSLLPNVTRHAGRLEDTLPKFTATYDAPIAFLHINCYRDSSTKFILDHLASRLRVGTVIAFNKYFNFPGWRNHEYRAFQELVQDRSLRYRYLAYNTAEWNVAIQFTR